MTMKFKGNPTPIEGTFPSLNEKAPAFTLHDLDDKAYTLDDILGKVNIISTFPNIDTSVCDKQTRAFYEKASQVDNVQLVNVSNNDKEALSSWCATNGIETLMLRDTDLTFAKDYGIWLPEITHLARSVFVLDKDGKIVYSELVPEVAQEPDYDKAIEAAKKLV